MQCIILICDEAKKGVKRHWLFLVKSDSDVSHIIKQLSMVSYEVASYYMMRDNKVKGTLAAVCCQKNQQ